MGERAKDGWVKDGQVNKGWVGGQVGGWASGRVGKWAGYKWAGGQVGGIQVGGWAG